LLTVPAVSRGSATSGLAWIDEQVGDMVFVTSSARLWVASGSSTIAALGVLIPVVVILLISAVPIYFRMSERRRSKQGAQEIQQQRGQRDITAEVEQMRREQAGE
jgi:hypothetical protein